MALRCVLRGFASSSRPFGSVLRGFASSSRLFGSVLRDLASSSRPLTGAPLLSSRTPAAGLRPASTAAPRGEQGAVVESTEEYRFVERLIPPTRIPDPPKHVGAAPSGWIPPAESPPPLPYMVRRSRMHNIPVYSELTHGNRKMTLLRKVEGDIWALEKDVREHLKGVTGKELPTQVNEVTMTLKVKGHYEQELKDWLLSRGF